MLICVSMLISRYKRIIIDVYDRGKVLVHNLVKFGAVMEIIGIFRGKPVADRR